MQTEAKFIYTDEATGITAIWHGGAYIDLGTVQDQGVPGINGDDFHAFDCINVWDYETATPRIPRTLEAFEATVREHLAENDDES